MKFSADFLVNLSVLDFDTLSQYFISSSREFTSATKLIVIFI